jgi:hypothetical protein
LINDFYFLWKFTFTSTLLFYYKKKQFFVIQNVKEKKKHKQGNGVLDLKD